MLSASGFVYLSRADVKALLAHASEDESRLHLSAVYFEREGTMGDSLAHIVATDGHRLAVAELAPIGFDLLLSRADLKKHGKRASAKQYLAVNATSIGIAENEGGPVADQLPVKPVDAEFPPWRQVLPEKLTTKERTGDIGFNAAYMADLALIALACGKRQPMVSIQIPEKPLDPIRFDVSAHDGNWFGAVMPCRI